MEEIDIKELFNEFLKRKILILIIIGICFAMIGIFSIFEKEKNITFTANSTILLTKSELENNEKIKEVDAIVTLINSDIMIDEIKSKLMLEVKKEDIIITSETDNIIQIDVTDTSKENVINISNVILDKLLENSFSIFETNGIELQIINFPDKNCKENIVESNLKLFLVVVSFIIPFGIVFVSYIFDTKIKSKDKIEKEFDVSVIDELRMIKKQDNSIENELTTIFDFKSENSKIFKIIVTKLLNKINIDEQNVLMITSPNENEGKTYVTSNIGTVLAMFGKKVIILDTNFENGKLDKIFKVPNTLGLSNYLTGMNGRGQEIKETLNNFIQETDIKNLNIITAGDIKENITNCLVSEKFDEFIKQLKFYYDFILIDSEKMLNVPNSLIIATKVNNSIVVVDRNSTKTEELISTINNIKEVNGKILGVIINETNKKHIKEEKIKNIKQKYFKQK